MRRRGAAGRSRRAQSGERQRARPGGLVSAHGLAQRDSCARKGAPRRKEVRCGVHAHARGRRELPVPPGAAGVDSLEPLVGAKATDGERVAQRLSDRLFVHQGPERPARLTPRARSQLVRHRRVPGARQPEKACSLNGDSVRGLMPAPWKGDWRCRHATRCRRGARTASVRGRSRPWRRAPSGADWRERHGARAPPGSAFVEFPRSRSFLFSSTPQLAALAAAAAQKPRK